MTPDEENRIVEQVLQGDRQAFSALVDAHKGAIYNLAFRMTGSYQDAEDLAQETFIRAYRNLRQFDPQKRFFTWLYTIGLNLIRNHLKKQGRDAARDVAAQNPSEGAMQRGPQVEQDLIRAQDISRLDVCLQQLPPDLREAVVLRFYQELSFEDISIITDTSISAAKMRVYRGLEQLKRLMEQ